MKLHLHLLKGLQGSNRIVGKVNESKSKFNLKESLNLKEIVHPKMKISWKCAHPQTIWDMDEFVSSSDLEKCHCISVSAMDALQWMGAVRMRVQTADKNITIIHTTPVHQLTSGEDKSWNKSIIKTFSIESIIHNNTSSSEKVFWSESGEKSASDQAPFTSQNSSKQICGWILIGEVLLWIMDSHFS